MVKKQKKKVEMKGDMIVDKKMARITSPRPNLERDR